MRNKAFALFSILLIGSGAFAQTVENSFNVGFPLNGIFSGSNFDSVQVSNGNLHIEIPIWSTGGRGLDIGAKFVYDSKVWKEQVNCHGHMNPTCVSKIIRAQPITLRLVNPFGYKIVHNRTAPSSQLPNTCSSMEWMNSYTLEEPDGTKHHFLPDPAIAGGTTFCGPLGTMYADDGSGWMLQVDPQSGEPQYGIRKDGTKITRVSGSFTQIEDSNGNFLYRNEATATNTDTLGRVIPDSASYFDSSGVQRTLQITNVNVTVLTNLCQFASGDYCDEWNQTVAVPQVIELPNGMRYTFTWEQNSDGVPLSVTLPTGGQISWTWRPAVDVAGRWVASRMETANGQDATWAYEQFFINFNKPDYVVVTDPADHQTKTIFTCLNPGFSDPAELPAVPPCHIADVLSYQGSVATGTLLKTVHTDYTGQLNSSRPGTILPIRETTTWAQANLVKKTETTYDILPVWSGNITWRNLKSTKEYDWGVGSAGALLRQTEFGYLHEANANYRNANIADRVVDKIVKDGAGNIKAQTHNNYDAANSMIASLPNAPNHNSAKGTN